MNSRDVRCHLFICLYIYISRSILEQEIAFIWRKHAQKNKHCLFVMLQWASDHGKIVYYIHMSYHCIACRVFLHWDILCFGNSHRCDARRARGGCQLWAATLQLRCPENRMSAHWISQYIWILEHISHTEWNWNFELSWTTALASCWCSFRFWQLEDEALREKHVHRKKLLHLLRNQARVGVGYATSNPQELHIDCDSTFPGRSKYHSQFKELTTGI